MEYSSFYGGRKGSSFIIKKSYPDIPTMVSDFSQGSSFTEVNFDEYVLINTVNKKHPDNGKLFRRGYDFNGNRKIEAYRAYAYNESTGEYSDEIINGTDEQYRDAHYEPDVDASGNPNCNSGGAVYVGTIVGPAGRAPHLKMTTYSIAHDITNSNQGFERETSNGEYVLSETDSDLLPGKYIDGQGNVQYNDAIQWFCTSLRDGYQQDTQVYIGLKIPYTIIDFETEMIDPYEQGEYADTTAAKRLKDDPEQEEYDQLIQHPFYEKWRLSIPKGVKGDTLNNFRIVIPSLEQDGEDNYLYPIYNIGTTDLYYTGQTYESSQNNFENDATNNRQIMVYDYYHYDQDQQGAKVTYYLGAYNNIQTVSIVDSRNQEDELIPDLDNGNINIEYTHDDAITFQKIFRYVQNAAFVENQIGNRCVLRLTYNTCHSEDVTDPQTEETVQEVVFDYQDFELDWVKNITFSQDGTIRVKNTSIQTEVINGTEIDQDTRIYSNWIKWINAITLVNNGNNQGYFQMTFNNNSEPFVANLHWINDISISDNGLVTLKYSQGEEVKQDKTLNVQLKWIDDITWDQFGVVTIDYNQGTSETVTGNNPVQWIKTLQLATDGTFKVIYNTLANDDPNNPIYNQQTICGNDGNTDRRLKWIDHVNLNTDGTFTVFYNRTNNQNQNETDTFANAIKWINEAKVTEDGKFDIKYNYGTPAEGHADPLDPTFELLTIIKYIQGISLVNGKLIVTYNTKTNGIDNDTSEFNLKTVNNITFTTNNENLGTFRANFNDGTSTPILQNLKLITDVNVADDGTFSLKYNNNTGNPDFTKKLRFPSELSVNNTSTEDPRQGGGNQKIHVKYTTATSSKPVEQDIGLPINYIMGVDRTDKHHLIVLHSDPVRRNNLGNEGYEHNGYIWQDLGPIISDQTGVLVGANFTWNEVYQGTAPQIKSLEVAKTYLNTHFPSGFNDQTEINGEKQPFLKEKIVTVGNDGENKEFFGFDYTINSWSQDTPSVPVFEGWYHIGELVAANAVVCVDLGATTPVNGNLPSGSLWFVTENIYNINYDGLVGVSISNKQKQIKQGLTYIADLEAETGTLSNVTVTMGGTDITSSVYSNGRIAINNTAQTYTTVTGDIVITATTVSE